MTRLNRCPARLAAGLVLAVWALSATADGLPVVTLEVDVHGLRSDSGAVGLALFNSEDSYDEGELPLRAGFVRIKERRARWVVPELPAGAYAVKAFHDSNGNGEFDLGALSIPKEPYGFSNDARGSFGPPPFERAQFHIGERRLVIEIRVD